MVQWRAVVGLAVGSDPGPPYQDLAQRFAAALGGLFTGTDAAARERAQILRRTDPGRRGGGARCAFGQEKIRMLY